MKEPIGIRSVMLHVPVFPPTRASKAFKAPLLFLIYVGAAATLALIRYLLRVDHDVVVIFFVVGSLLPVCGWLYWTLEIARSVRRSLRWASFYGEERYFVARRGVVTNATASKRIAWMRLGTPPNLYCSMAFFEVAEGRVLKAHHVAVQGRNDWALQLWKEPIETWHLSGDNVQTWKARGVHYLGLPREIGADFLAPAVPPTPATARLVDSDAIWALLWLDGDSNTLGVSVHDSIDQARAQLSWEAGIPA